MSETIESGQAKPLAVAEQKPQELASWTPTFAVSVEQAAHNISEKRRFFELMTEGQHYGKVPGTDKPTLLKPGAEWLLSNMGLRPVLTDESEPIIDLSGENHIGADGKPEAFIAYRRKCQIYRQTGPTEHERILIAEASGSCNSWEKKYRYRGGQRICPNCGKPTIIKGKQFDTKLAAQGVPGDWACWKKEGKSDGCNSKFPPNSPEGKALEAQSVEPVKNPDVADLDNTILKMADKRAMVAATLLATGCSDIFTQDMEDRLPEDSAPPTDQYQPPADAPRDQARREAVVIPTVKEMKEMFLATGRKDVEWESFVVVNCGANKGEIITGPQKVALLQAIRKLHPVDLPESKPQGVLQPLAEQAGLELGQ